MAAENAPKTAGWRFAMLQAVLQLGMSDNRASLRRRGSRGNMRWTSTNSLLNKAGPEHEQRGS